MTLLPPVTNAAEGGHARRVVIALVIAVNGVASGGHDVAKSDLGCSSATWKACRSGTDLGTVPTAFKASKRSLG